MKFRETTAALLLTSLGLTGLTGCAAGGNAETRNIRQVTDGVEKNLDAIKLRNVKIVALPDGSGTLVGFVVTHSDDADQLVGISINGKMAQLQGANILNKNVPVVFEGEAATAKAKVAALGERAGYRVPVIFYFANSGKIELDSLIVANTGIYSSIL